MFIWPRFLAAVDQSPAVPALRDPNPPPDLLYSESVKLKAEIKVYFSVVIQR